MWSWLQRLLSYFQSDDDEEQQQRIDNDSRPSVPSAPRQLQAKTKSIYPKERANTRSDNELARERERYFRFPVVPDEYPEKKRKDKQVDGQEVMREREQRLSTRERQQGPSLRDNPPVQSPSRNIDTVRNQEKPKSFPEKQAERAVRHAEPRPEQPPRVRQPDEPKKAYKPSEIVSPVYGKITPATREEEHRIHTTAGIVYPRLEQEEHLNQLKLWDQLQAGGKGPAEEEYASDHPAEIVETNVAIGLDETDVRELSATDELREAPIEVAASAVEWETAREEVVSAAIEVESVESVEWIKAEKTAAESHSSRIQEQEQGNGTSETEAPVLPEGREEEALAEHEEGAFSLESLEEDGTAIAQMATEPVDLIELEEEAVAELETAQEAEQGDDLDSAVEVSIPLLESDPDQNPVIELEPEPEPEQSPDTDAEIPRVAPPVEENSAGPEKEETHELAESDRYTDTADEVAFAPAAAEAHIAASRQTDYASDVARLLERAGMDAPEAVPDIAISQPLSSPPLPRHVETAGAGSVPAAREVAAVSERAGQEEQEPSYELPQLDLLNPGQVPSDDDDEHTQLQKLLLEETLSNFNVSAQVVGIVKGPSVTRFELQPAPGVKVNKITGLIDDIKLNLAAKDIRIEAPIPGRNAIGIEVPNLSSRPVMISTIIGSDKFLGHSSPLAVALGMDIGGEPIIADIKKMPHGLIAGSTGSGKSVCINSIIVSLLYKATPEQVRLLLIDPKMVELAPYNHLPHLVTPVVTEAKQATAALKWAVEEMEKRYALFVDAGVRDIDRYNQTTDDQLPYIVIVIDELADLMMVSPQDVEDCIIRIAQKARACGIHLLLATQRPSVDVITGNIKANVPTRLAFAVFSQVDSRTILDQSGAERLLGRGDMLFLESGTTPIRLQGNFVSDDEIERITQVIKKQRKPSYIFSKEDLEQQVQSFDAGDDPLYLEALVFVAEQGQASASGLQRRFRVGYNRAARLIEMMEADGYVAGQSGGKARAVLITREDAQAVVEGSTLL
ncbi:DNA translocase FtsK [Brevibacillus nitrificans]|uniref:DNA translocase FtsK n=1 Tax=Brevibacillus nitrificans TaxID=651560 RepID=A0A3M8CXS4_9BACL|nr:DNA translocase FtsK [Brevibacillus nitrificans]RNB80574.1 DNA translocase FtsK [Brevibacillus nitrificans]